MLNQFKNGVQWRRAGGSDPVPMKELAAYKAAPAAKQSPSGQARRTITMALSGASLQEIPDGAFVLSPESTVNRWSQASTLIMQLFPLPRHRQAVSNRYAPFHTAGADR